MILEKIHSPADVKALDKREVEQLCAELRRFLVDSVSQTGGHLASNLGAVELTVALHRVFNTERDRLVFDVGHQCYVHKALTGRRELFSTLRTFGGLSGFPKPYESQHDAFVAGHASNSVSVALGMARARSLRHDDYAVIALIGDGALTGGLAYEGLNNAGESGEPLIVILNDNGMSINPNVGAMSNHLSRLRSRPGYYHFKKWYRKALGNSDFGKRLYRFNHKIKTTVKRAIWPGSTLFEDMGFTYLGPVDGHNVDRLCHVLQWARELNGPVVVHVNTVKGKGY
ncbi:MAG: 1-deoxy-D-xylulose-5-phosphate synthase N-terminal domain-containing protein, partial [Candidatus Onthomonas sp.]|nr:1-deoxy-D-xylulose-5-phosphate synthase N-terminal domain-containing protein [Candidatus Onthomonas sp.]